MKEVIKDVDKKKKKMVSGSKSMTMYVLVLGMGHLFLHVFGGHMSRPVYIRNVYNTYFIYDRLP